MIKKSKQSKPAGTMERRRFIKKCSRMAMWGLSAGLLPFQCKSATLSPLFEPPYLKLHKSGELKKRGETLWQMMENCSLCPRQCGAQRLKGEEGFCHSSSQLEISSYQRHFGEEEPLVGSGGSGTIFFTNCNLRCVFCINWEINHKGIGKRESIDSLARMMLKIQTMGCSNINVVTPTHYSPHIVKAVDKAAGMGVKLPLVYNTSGWERMEVLKILDGIVDIYLPDFKYWDSKMSDRYSSGADTYPEITKKALLEMHRQVGTAKPEPNGLMVRGLMIRHLVLPNRVSGSRGVVQWIARNLPKDTYLNIMSQYRPAHKARNYPKIARPLKSKEYREVVKCAKEAGLTNLDIQGYRWTLG